MILESLLVLLVFSQSSYALQTGDYWTRIPLKRALQPGPLEHRIIGGENASIKEYPFAVSLQRNGTHFGHDVEHFCGGSIIADSWIITSAQCALSLYVEEFHARVGSACYYKDGWTHGVERVVIHPMFDKITYDYDVGLIKLKEAIDFDDAKKPIKLPRRNIEIKDEAEISVVGWGATKYLGVYSETLRYSVLPKISNKECILTYDYQVTDRMFCIVSKESSPCVGDSGSSAVLNDTLIGVASWSASCNGYPTAYTALPELMDWIEKVSGVS